MGLQMIFVVETNRNVQSDWIYIKETINRFYQINQAHVKLSPVYMDGNTKYKDKEREINTLIKQYNNAAAGNKSKVIFCFDCDDYDLKPEVVRFLEETQRYCSNHGYEYVWFCKDIERVFLGRKVSDKDKKKEAAKFKAKHLIDNVNRQNLSVDSYRTNASNLLKILDKVMQLLD